MTWTDWAAVLRTECGLRGGGQRPGRSKETDEEVTAQPGHGMMAAQTRRTAGEEARHSMLHVFGG